MKKEGNNLDDLLKGKLSGEAYPFKEAYWQSAQQVIKANGVKAASGFALSKLTIALSIAVASVASFGLGWFVFSPDTNSNQNSLSDASLEINQVIATKKELPKTDLTTPNPEKKSILPIAKKDSKSQKNIGLKEALKTNYYQKTKVFSTESSDIYDISKILTFAKSIPISNNQNPKVKKEEGLKAVSEEISLSKNQAKNENEAIKEQSTFKGFNLSEEEVFSREIIATSVENRSTINKYELLGLQEFEVKSSFNASYQEENHKNLSYLEVEAKLQAYASTGNQLEELNIGTSVFLRKQLGNNFLIGGGLQFESVSAKQATLTSIISEIEVPYENTYLQEEYIEKTRLVDGIIFNQGVPINGKVEETYYDTLMNSVTETRTVVEQDTAQVATNNNYKANYFDIPLEVTYGITFKKMDIRFSISPSFGLLANKSQNLGEASTVIQVPTQRIMLATTTQLGYYFSSNLNLTIGCGYRKNFNAIVGKGNQLGGNIGLRYNF